MPLILVEECFKDVIFGIWHITESENDMLAGLILTDDDYSIIKNMKLKKRRLERSACRKLLSALIKTNDIKITYGEYGEPQTDGYIISFSHSNSNVAVAFSKKLQIGIDIQKIDLKIGDLFNKFISEQEKLIFDIKNIEVLTKVWTVKEAVYKCLKNYAFDFKTQIIVYSNYAEAIIDDQKCIFKYHSLLLQNYIISVAVKQ